MSDALPGKTLIVIKSTVDRDRGEPFEQVDTFGPGAWKQYLFEDDRLVVILPGLHEDDETRTVYAKGRWLEIRSEYQAELTADQLAALRG